MPAERMFGDPDLTPDNSSSFSKQEIDVDTKAKGLEQLEPFKAARSTDPMELSSVIGTELEQKIVKAGQIVFHAVGDTGGIHNPEFQFAVADAMADDLASGASFWYHLGDVVYYFGQDQYYFDQFYDPFTGSPSHVPSPTMLKEIDQICSDVGILPDLYLSGHAHLYERYTRTVRGKRIPYVVAGMGGYYNLPGLKPPNRRPPPQKTPQSGTDASGNPLRLDVYNDNTFGFLRVTVSPTSVAADFITVDPASGKTGIGDNFAVDLKANTVSSGASRGAAGARGGKATASSGAGSANRPTTKKASKAATKAPKSKSGSSAAKKKRG